MNVYWVPNAGFTLGVLSLLIIVAQRTFAFSKSEMRVLERGVKYVQSWWWRHHNDVNDVVLMSLLFALDMLHVTVCCFRFWLCACRCLQGIICCKHLILHFCRSSGFEKSWAKGWLVLLTKCYKRIVWKLCR